MAVFIGRNGNSKGQIFLRIEVVVNVFDIEEIVGEIDNANIQDVIQGNVSVEVNDIVGKVVTNWSNEIDMNIFRFRPKDSDEV